MIILTINFLCMMSLDKEVLVSLFVVLSWMDEVSVVRS
jgi:hypothetical protein